MNLKVISALLFSIMMIVSCKDANKSVPTPPPAATVAQTTEQANTEVTFKGGGNEPFWSVEFKEGRIHFSAPSEVLRSFVAPIPEPEVSGNISKYTSKSRRVIMEVLLIEEECVDSMSGKKNSRKVKLSIKPIAEEDFRVFEGCGSYSNE